MGRGTEEGGEEKVSTGKRAEGEERVETGREGWRQSDGEAERG